MRIDKAALNDVLLDAMKSAVKDMNFNVTCPHCGKEVSVPEGKSRCPLCGQPINVVFDFKRD